MTTEAQPPLDPSNIPVFIEGTSWDRIEASEEYQLAYRLHITIQAVWAQIAETPVGGMVRPGEPIQH